MSSDHLFRLFVYGTLKRGYWNHDAFCSEAASIEDATVRGKLYEFASGIPVLEVPERDVIAHGSANIVGDLAIQRDLEVSLSEHLECDGETWRQIEGELVSLPNPAITLPPIDRLEGFNPNGASLYHRVLVPVMSGGGVTAAWCYVSSSRTLKSACATHRTRWPGQCSSDQHRYDRGW